MCDEICEYCGSTDPDKCMFCVFCENHSKTCKNTNCKIQYCNCNKNFKYMMSPWVDFLKERKDLPNDYCTECIDELMEKNFLQHISMREIGIKKQRKVKLVFKDDKIIPNFNITTS